ncbi:MAG: TatD family hydrolase [Burkholderiaceae bacterium]|nr:TatD family hydrolase [Burkholderiaceae bacterium]
MYIDSHCHLDFPDFSNRIEQVFERMDENQVDGAMCISVTLEGFPAVLALAERHPRLLATAGVHPDYPDDEEPDVARLVAMADHPRVRAIGETGLDYYRLQGDLEWQRERFRTHIRAARACAKPLVIHTRSAAEDTIRIMREEGAEQAGGVLHCFTEAWETASAAIDMGFCISFSGIVTFKNAVALREVAKRVPEAHLLIETDSPYLAPVPYRGKTNEPGFVRFVGEQMARIRGVSAAHLAELTSSNFHRLFKEF